MSPADSVLTVNDKQVLRVQLGSHRGRLFCAVRFWYLDKESGVLRPSKRGISLPAMNLPEIIEGQEKIVAQMVKDGAFESTGEGRPLKFNPQVYPADF